MHNRQISCCGVLLPYSVVLHFLGKRYLAVVTNKTET